MMKGFVNPYNFIKFPKKKAEAYPDEDCHTGVINYTITTKTPLFIPNSSSDCAFGQSDALQDHKSYDFFSYTELDGKKRYENEYHVPVIPGSEIRGVVRNVYETLTDSCMGLLNAEEYPVKRSMENFRPALLYRNRNGRYSLYEARSLRIGEFEHKGKAPKGFENYANGTEIYYRNPPKNQPGVIEEYSAKRGRYPLKGYLIKWGMGGTKKRYHLFEAKSYGNVDAEVKGILVSKDEIERKLLRVIDYYLDEPAIEPGNKKAYEEYKKDVENFLKEKGEGYFPVNYSKLEKGIYYLAPATFTKEVSDNNIGKLAGAFAPCTEKICPACDLFGYVGKSSELSKGSKIRFTDMYVTEEKEDPKDYYVCDHVTIQALGEPKLGNTEFYLRRPKGASFWNYDYYIQNGKPVMSDGVLRGRKYYWHHRNVNLKEEIEVTKLNKTIRPVKDNVKFGGQLYYEGISERQLEQLIWILNSGTENLGLKLGGAKPLGYGSVTCKVDEVQERTVGVSDGKVSYQIVAVPTENITYEKAGLSEPVKKEFYKIAGLNSVPADVEITYPKDKTQKGQTLTEGYRWFVNNHTTWNGRMVRSRTDVKIVAVLPEILEEDFSLPYNSKPYGGRPQSSKFQNKRR